MTRDARIASPVFFGLETGVFMSCRFIGPAVVAAVAVLSSPAAADSLGFRFAEATIGGISGGDGVQGSARLRGDFALTGSHGLQLDLSVVSYGDEFLGQLDGHLYMMPAEAAKYGLFFSLADMDGREATLALVGVEGMFALSDATEVHGRAGIGMALPDTMEFIALSVGASHAVNDQVAIYGDLTMAEVDEAALRAMTTSARIGISYQPAGRPWEVSASVVRDGISGRNAAAFETRAELGFTLHLGGGGGAKRGLSKRGFAAMQAFDPLLRRGMF